jgi:Zn-finger domain-containing protein
MPVFVNKIEISDNEIHKEMQFHPAPDLAEARKEASRALIIRQLLLDAVVDFKLLKLDDLDNMDDATEESAIEALLEEIIHVPSADSKTCQRYYENHLERFIDKKTNETLPFNMVQNYIENYLNDKGHQAALNAYIDSLMDKANIVGM